MLKKLLKMLDSYGADCFFGLECKDYNLNCRTCRKCSNSTKYKNCEKYRAYYEKYVDEK